MSEENSEVTIRKEGAPSPNSRSAEPGTSEAKVPAQKAPNPMGLALSGGGFRATAFHLGVLKRLREIGILQEVNLLSTVSGGSIAGAGWLHWHLREGDTGIDQQWNEFESCLIDIMRGGLRGRIFWFLFVPPLASAGVGLAELSHHFELSLMTSLLLSATAIPIAYCFWHYFSSSLLARQYDRLLFHGATIRDLQGDAEAPSHPRLIVNAS
jgi:NTE family protein